METLEQDLSHAYPMFVVDETTHVPVLPERVGEVGDTPAHLLSTIIVEAYRIGVAEVSIEADVGDAAAHVWFSLDGVMLDYMQVPAYLRAALVAHVKFLCGLDVDEWRIAQIGRIDFERVGAEKIELRVATLPNGSGGEHIRLRLSRVPLALVS